MAFLHRHHTSEDEGLWPLVRRCNPAAAPLLDSLEEDHARVAPAAEDFAAAGQAYAASEDDDSRRHLLGALDQLRTVLVPHLDREVAEGMPIVSASITRAEWQAWDQAYNIKARSFRELGLEGHWLLDGADAEGRHVLLQLVPPVPRFLVLHGFGWAYRRGARRRWRAGNPVLASGVST